MLKPDFTKYDLALVQNDTIVHSETGKGLRPLINCLNKFRTGKYILFDKLFGLAAAKMIVHRGIITKLVTGTISESALEFLRENKIEVEADLVVPNILTEDRKEVCMMEKKALSLSEKEFLIEAEKIFGYEIS
ncbi:MAG: DUF1893 domain-containing protein [Candidatus Delongbacteria bacterium]|nr:DUF1893 domain-containing protein [Candidatus Delongbacteria bacterium]